MLVFSLLKKQIVLAHKNENSILVHRDFMTCHNAVLFRNTYYYVLP